MSICTSPVPRHHADVPGFALDERALKRFCIEWTARAINESAPLPWVISDAIRQVFFSHVNREICAQLLADLQTRVAGASQDNAFRTERFAKLHRNEADGSGSEHQHRLAGDIASHEIDRPQRRSGSGHHASLLE
jgi:hypothetical protein